MGDATLGRSSASAARPVDRRHLLAGLAGLAIAWPAAVHAQGEHSPPQAQVGSGGGPAEFAKLPPAEKWKRRFPQPVLVSDLIGRQMLDRDQGVLGTIDTVVATPDGEVHIAFHRRRLVLFRGDTVVVPNVMAALLGPFVMLPEMSDAEIAALPAYRPAAYQALDGGSHIRMALTKN